jgi:replicative DNA helicase
VSLDLDKKIISLLSQDNNLFAKSLGDIDPSYLKGPYSKIYKLLTSQYSSKQTIPTLDLLEGLLFKYKDKIFDPGTNADEFLVSLRAETAVTETRDYEFLLDEIKKRRSKDIALEKLPQVADLIKKSNVEEAANLLVSIGNSMNTTVTSSHILKTSDADYADTLWQKYNATKKNPTEAWGYKTGFADLDAATHGLNKGELFLVCARPGCGKSMFLLSVATNMRRQGKKVLYVSIEMPTEQIWQRTAANWSGLEINKIAEGTLSEEEEALYRKSLDELKKGPGSFVVLDAPNVTVPTIASEIDKMVENTKPDVVFVDYLGIVRPTEKGLADNISQANIVEDLRAMARMRKIGVFSAVQLNRDKQKSKGTDRLARSDVIAQTADLILQIEEIEIEEEVSKLSDKLNVYVIKNRKGKDQFAFPTRKNFECAQFQDWVVTSWSE